MCWTNKIHFNMSLIDFWHFVDETISLKVWGRCIQHSEKEFSFTLDLTGLSSPSALVVGWNCFHCMKLLFHLPWVSLQYFHFIFQFSVFPLRFSQLKCPWKQVDWSGLIRTDCRCQTEMTTSLKCLRNKHNRETICMLSWSCYLLHQHTLSTFPGG